MRSTALWRPSVTLITIAGLMTACSDAPTAPRGVCTLANVGPSLAMTIPNAVALQPVLDDARTRILPTLSVAPATLPPALLDLRVATIAGDAAESCRAFNAAAAALDAMASSAPDAELPDIDALRLALRLTHIWLSAN